MSDTFSSEALICPHCGHEDWSAGNDLGPGMHVLDCESCKKEFSCEIEIQATFRAWTKEEGGTP